MTAFASHIGDTRSRGESRRLRYDETPTPVRHAVHSSTVCPQSLGTIHRATRRCSPLSRHPTGNRLAPCQPRFDVNAPLFRCGSFWADRQPKHTVRDTRRNPRGARARAARAGLWHPKREPCEHRKCHTCANRSLSIRRVLASSATKRTALACSTPSTLVCSGGSVDTRLRVPRNKVTAQWAAGTITLENSRSTANLGTIARPIRE